MGTMGRPRKEMDMAEFEKLCRLQCTKAEIASWFDMSEDSVERRCAELYEMTFAAVFALKRGKGKISLRRTQWSMAEKSPAMAIFLGKQFLDQSDKREEKLEHKGHITLGYNLDDEPEK